MKKRCFKIIYSDGTKSNAIDMELRTIQDITRNFIAFTEYGQRTGEKTPVNVEFCEVAL